MAALIHHHSDRNHLRCGGSLRAIVILLRKSDGFADKQGAGRCAFAVAAAAVEVSLPQW
jgi:hypothetical protein